jgi:hypothetical protein
VSGWQREVQEALEDHQERQQDEKRWREEEPEMAEVIESGEYPLGPCGCTDYHMADCPVLTERGGYEDPPEPDDDYDPERYRDEDEPDDALDLYLEEVEHELSI